MKKLYCLAIAAAANMLLANPAAASTQVGKFTVNFALGIFQHNGDFVIPGQTTGVSPDGDFRADRATGNYQRHQVTLIGHVLLHQRVASQPGRPPQPPMTLTSDQLSIDGSVSMYTATGSVKAVQGARTILADYMQLNDKTHDATLRNNVHAAEAGRVVDTQELHFNTVSGALLVPVPLTGHGTDGDFRADRADGNQRSGTFTLYGNVVVHRLGGTAKIGGSQEPVTLYCDRLDIANATKLYVADGHVRVIQAGRTLSGPHLQLDGVTHIATMTGGVHGTQNPNRTFDAAQLIYNTETEDFKVLGGVRMTFPFQRGTPAPRPSGSPSPQPTKS